MRERMTLREKIEARIASRPGEDVFLPREFRDLGGEDQVLRVLRTLVQEKRLVRLGYGVYGRAVVSRLSGDPVLFAQNGFQGAVRQALPPVIKGLIAEAVLPTKSAHRQLALLLFADQPLPFLR